MENSDTIYAQQMHLKAHITMSCTIGRCYECNLRIVQYHFHLKLLLKYGHVGTMGAFKYRSNAYGAVNGGT